MAACGNSFCTTHRSCRHPVETVSAPPAEALAVLHQPLEPADSRWKPFLHHSQRLPAACGNNFRPAEAVSTPAIIIAGSLFRSWPQGLPATCRRSFYARPQRLWGANPAPAAEAAGSLWKQVLLPSAAPPWEAISAPPAEPARSLWKQFLHHPQRHWQPVETIPALPTEPAGSLRKRYIRQFQGLFGSFYTRHRHCWQPVPEPAARLAGNL